ncbi:MAG: serine/threonine-protein kinase [Myxococcota bacterium]
MSSSGEAPDDRFRRLLRRAGRSDPMQDIALLDQVDGLLFGDSTAKSRPEQLGRYVVVDRVGQGGFGTVYEAYDPELARRVAIKLLHIEPARTLDTAGEQEIDLLEEARAMAKVVHRHVATVYDVGEAPSGGVFIVMEFLPGSSLREWVEAAPRSHQEIVGVLADAGRGLSAAHERGILHLDFKPSNVMFDEDGHPRVMDFGLSRLVDVARAAGKKGPLGSSSVVGTPPYMSPEQQNGDPLDARADQYAFCVTLYEMLHGRRPFDGLTAGELLVAKRQDPPSFDAERVPGWIAAVIARGLAPRAEERFASMGELLAALADDPHQRRRRWFMAAAAVATAGLVGLGGYQIDQGRYASCSTHPALDGVWNATVRGEIRDSMVASELAYAADTADRVETAVEAWAGEWAEARHDVCRATIDGGANRPQLSAASLCLDKRLRRLAALTTQLQRSDAATIRSATRSAVSLPAPKECLEPVEASGLAPLDRDTVLEIESHLADGLSSLNLERREEGIPAALDALELARSAGDIDGMARASALHGQLLSDTDKNDARASLHSAMALAAKAGRGELETTVMIRLAELELGVGRYPVSRSLLELAAQRVAQGLVSSRMRVIHGLVFARLERESGNFEESEVLLQGAMELEQEFFGDESPRLANLYDELGVLLIRWPGRHNESEEYLRRALRQAERTLGPDHPYRLVPFSNLGAVTLLQGKLDEAEAIFEETLRMHVQGGLGTKRNAAVNVQNLAIIDQRRGRYTQALKRLDDAQALRESLVDEDHPWRADLDLLRCEALMLSGRHAEAERACVSAIERTDRLLGEDHPRVGAPSATLVNVFERAGDPRFDDALAQLDALFQRQPDASAGSTLLALRLRQALRDGDVDEIRRRRAELVGDGPLGDLEQVEFMGVEVRVMHVLGDHARAQIRGIRVLDEAIERGAVGYGFGELAVESTLSLLATGDRETAREVLDRALGATANVDLDARTTRDLAALRAHLDGRALADPAVFTHPDEARIVALFES